MSGRCKDCRWWDSESAYSDFDKPTSDVRHCLCDHILKVKDMEGRQEWDDDMMCRTIRIEEDEAVAYDGSDYLSTFSTGPEFGCVHFEKREA